MEKISIKTSQKFMKEVANKSLLSFMDALGFSRKSNNQFTKLGLNVVFHKKMFLCINDLQFLKQLAVLLATAKDIL